MLSSRRLANTFEMGFLIGWELDCQVNWLAGESQNSFHLCHLRAEIGRMLPHITVLLGSRHQNSHPPACNTSVLSTELAEPSPSHYSV